jgi:hypothetical protein
MADCRVEADAKLETGRFAHIGVMLAWQAHNRRRAADLTLGVLSYL